MRPMSMITDLLVGNQHRMRCVGRVRVTVMALPPQPPSLDGARRNRGQSQAVSTRRGKPSGMTSRPAPFSFVTRLIAASISESLQTARR